MDGRYKKDMHQIDMHEMDMFQAEAKHIDLSLIHISKKRWKHERRGNLKNKISP